MTIVKNILLAITTVLLMPIWFIIVLIADDVPDGYWEEFSAAKREAEDNKK